MCPVRKTKKSVSIGNAMGVLWNAVPAGTLIEIRP
jgi:hypothetical protein